MAIVTKKCYYSNTTKFIYLIYFYSRCPTDQQALWDLGAVPMLQHLTNSKHKTISQCSAGALKNLYAAKPSGMLDMVSKGASYGMPSLQARKRRNMVRMLTILEQVMSKSSDIILLHLD